MSTFADMFTIAMAAAGASGRTRAAAPSDAANGMPEARPSASAPTAERAGGPATASTRVAAALTT